MKKAANNPKKEPQRKQISKRPIRTELLLNFTDNCLLCQLLNLNLFDFWHLICDSSTDKQC